MYQSQYTFHPKLNNFAIRGNTNVRHIELPATTVASEAAPPAGTEVTTEGAACKAWFRLAVLTNRRQCIPLRETQ